MKLCRVALLVAVLGSSGSFAADDFRSISIPYSTDTPVTVGSGIDIDLINQVRTPCLANIEEKDILWLDGDGAVATTFTVDLVSDYKSLEKTLGLEVDYKSKADVSVAALKAGGSMDLHLKYDTFAKDESRTLAIVVKAASDYGRHGLRTYKLDKEFSDLISAGKLAEFRQRCGTNTVVAEHKVASVSVVIQVRT